MKFRNKKIATLGIFIGLGFAVFGGAVDFAYAVDNSSYIPLAPLPGTMNDKGQVSLNTYIPGVFNLAIGIAGVLAVLMIVIGGVEYMTTDAIYGTEEAKARINNALTGLLLVLVSWILLHTINPRLTIFDLNVADQKITRNQSINTNDNTFINKGNSATKLQQSSNSSVDKFKQQGNSSSNNVFMHSTQ